MTIRAVFDTNTAISAMLWGGVPHRAFNADETFGVLFFSSPFLLREVATVLERAKFDRAFSKITATRARLTSEYFEKVHVVDPKAVPDVIPGDSTDNHVLACAVEAQADVVVSGDGHLRDIGSYSGIPIMNAADFLDHLHASGGDPEAFRRRTRPSASQSPT